MTMMERIAHTPMRVARPRLRSNDGVDRLTVFGRDDWNAPPASGSNPPDAYVICPCSMGALVPA